MSDEKKRAAEAAADEPTYTHDELIAAARSAFGVQPEVVVGALHGQRRKLLSRSEAGRLVKDFLDREVR